MFPGERPENINHRSLREKKKFRIQVFEGDLSKPKVNVNIPLGLAEMTTKFIPKSVKSSMNFGGEEFDLQEIIAMVQEGNVGTLFEVEDVLLRSSHFCRPLYNLIPALLDTATKRLHIPF